jgi:hypothetical protein
VTGGNWLDGESKMSRNAIEGKTAKIKEEDVEIN